MRSRFFFLACACSAFFSGCASVQSSHLFRSSYKLQDCRVYAIPSNFSSWPAQDEIALHLAREIVAALNRKGINATYSDSTPKEVAAILWSRDRAFGTLILVEGEQIVVSREGYGSFRPNGISFHKVSVYEESTGLLVAEYHLRVATGLQSFKSSEGGFRDTAYDFVEQAIDSAHQLLAPVK